MSEKETERVRKRQRTKLQKIILIGRWFGEMFDERNTLNNEKNVVLLIRRIYPSIQRLIVSKRSPRGYVHVRVRGGEV